MNERFGWAICGCYPYLHMNKLRDVDKAVVPIFPIYRDFTLSSILAPIASVFHGTVYKSPSWQDLTY